MSTETIVKKFLEDYGFTITIIDRDDGKTPDLLVRDSDCAYLLEVKDKLLNLAKLAERERVLSANEIYKDQETTGRTNTLDGIVTEACVQLSEFKGASVDFRLLWLQARGLDPELQIRQVFATLYGLKYVLEADSKTNGIECLYADFNAFHRHGDVLDGAILVEKDIFQFCLNSFSPKYQKLSESNLARLFGKGLFDPLALESEGKIFIADFDVDRRNISSMLIALQKKYKTGRLTFLTLQQFTAEMRNPNPFLIKKDT